MDEYLKIDKDKFWKKFSEKYSDKNFKVVIDTPFEKHMLYSQEEIDRKDFIDVIYSMIKECKLDQRGFNPDDLAIKIDDKKMISFSISSSIKNTKEGEEVCKELEGDVKTQIEFNINKSVDGTELAIKIIQELQKKYNNIAFKRWSNLLLVGEKVQAMFFDGDFMRDPDLKDVLEYTKD